METMPGGGEAKSSLGGVSGDMHSFSAIRQNSTISDESAIHAWIKTSETLANRLTELLWSGHGIFVAVQSSPRTFAVL
jgi:hypothetical protein